MEIDYLIKHLKWGKMGETHMKKQWRNGVHCETQNDEQELPVLLATSETVVHGVPNFCFHTLSFSSTVVSSCFVNILHYIKLHGTVSDPSGQWKVFIHRPRPSEYLSR